MNADDWFWLTLGGAGVLGGVLIMVGHAVGWWS